MSRLTSGIDNLIPAYILEQYPNFVLFLKGYYEWVSSGDRPQAVLDKHLDRLSFKESLDEYTEQLKNKYLLSIPSDVIANKELMIQWSKKFYRSKGSFYSYEFLFRTLFNSDAEIHLPKNEIFRLSDGKWIDDESVLFVTPVDGVDTNAFLYKKIKQVRQIYNSVYEYAYASVQRINIRIYGGYRLTELYISNIKGTFKPGYPIQNDDGDIAWLMPIASTATVVNPGTNFQPDDVLLGDIPPYFSQTYTATEVDVEQGYIDTKINTFFNYQDLEFYLNNQIFTPVYDGQHVVYSFTEGDVLRVNFPTYVGLTTVSSVSGSEIAKVNILDPIIGSFDSVELTHSNSGVSASVVLHFDVVSDKQGYYINNDSMLSADRYLQDSRYYQEYSYVLRTEVDIERYREIVLKTVHPAGMKLFGMVSLSALLSMLIEIAEDTIQALPGIKTYLPKYSLGPNLSMIDRLKANLDTAVWRVEHIDDIPVKFWIGSENYRLYAYQMVIQNLFQTAQRQDVSSEVGWMTSHGFADLDIKLNWNYGYMDDNYVEVDYVVKDLSRGYEDQSYVEERYHYS